jgi:hypothetical protein
VRFKKYDFICPKMMHGVLLFTKLIIGLSIFLHIAAETTVLECPDKCTCDGNVVKCRGRQAMPSTCPPATTILDLRYNNISMLMPIQSGGWNEF